MFSRVIIFKVRAAPIKKLYLSRLKLMSAAVGISLTAYFLDHLKKKKVSPFFWRFLMIGLQLIKGYN